MSNRGNLNLLMINGGTRTIYNNSCPFEILFLMEQPIDKQWQLPSQTVTCIHRWITGSVIAVTHMHGRVF